MKTTSLYCDRRNALSELSELNSREERLNKEFPGSMEAAYELADDGFMNDEEEWQHGDDLQRMSMVHERFEFKVQDGGLFIIMQFIGFWWNQNNRVWVETEES